VRRSETRGYSVDYYYINFANYYELSYIVLEWRLFVVLCEFFCCIKSMLYQMFVFAIDIFDSY
jgi:hypothetical protein